MRDVLILIVSLVTLLGITGCAENGWCISPGESIECQRLRVLWERAGEENPQIIIPETESESGDEMSWQELGELVSSAVGCCFCKPHPLAREWVECNRLDCVLEYLAEENIRNISLYVGVLEDNAERPEEWYNLWVEVDEPNKIKTVTKLLCEAVKKEKNRFINEDIVISTAARMQIITDKHRFIIPISCYNGAIRGIGWTSYELRGQLKKWGFSDPK